MRPVSLAKEAENAERWKVTMPFVRKRDANVCIGRTINPETGKSYLPERCYGPTHGHEIITRAQGGSITDPANVVLLCDGHNRWCTENTDEAIELGFRQLRYDPYSSTVADRLPHLPVHRGFRQGHESVDHSRPDGADGPAARETHLPVSPARVPLVTMRADPREWAAAEGIPYFGEIQK